MLDIKKIEAAINQISAEKNIPKENLIDIIESAIKTAYKKDYWSKDENVFVHLNLDSWEIEVSVEKTIVKEVKNPATEISFEELWEDWEWFEEWDTIELDVTDSIMWESFWESFWRIASQAARQVIIQKIWENEKQKIYDLFKDKLGKILSMKVLMVESWKIILDYNWNQVILPRSEQTSRDNYVPDARFYIYVAEISNDEKYWPRVILSRKRPEIVWALFEMYVPELEDGIINIEKIVRKPWVKTKILVSTNDEDIDPSWTLIWQKWIRVKSVMEELSWEKIDIISVHDSLENIISKSLTPAVVSRVVVDEEKQKALVFMPLEERSKAIWKNGFNIDLASELIWYDIEIKEIENKEQKMEE